jgi:outer membrane protein, heavy metal efflux system
VSGLVLLLLVGASPIAPVGTDVSFDAALEGVDGAPDVQSLAQSANVRKAGLSRLGVFTSNPQVLLQPGVRTERGASAPEGQVTLTQNFNLGGLAGSRKEVATADAHVAAVRARLTRQERRIAAADAWLEVWAAQLASHASHQEEQAAKALAERLEVASRSGGATRVESATAAAFAAEASALHLEWEGRRVEASAALSSLLGLDGLAMAAGPLPNLQTPAEGAQVGMRPLSVQLAEAELVAERRRAQEVQATWATQLQTSVQGGHDAPTQWFANVGLGLTLPVFERGARERLGHEATALRLEGELSLAQRQAAVRRQLVEHELEHTAETLTVVKQLQLPAAEEAATLEAKRHALGEATLLELTLLRRQALLARIAAIVAEARLVGARVHARELWSQP